MKIRNGFVSNSSSSSFVVTYRERANFNTPDNKRKSGELVLTKEQVKLLRKGGFKLSSVGNPYFVGTLLEENSPTQLRKYQWYMPVYFTYDILCNQDDVIYTLLENKIPFTALCHYDDELVAWDGKSDYFINTPNNIELSIRQGPKSLEKPKVDKINIKKWMDDYKKWALV